jgi:hypothetical protein
MLDRFCKFLLAQMEQFLPSIEISRLARFFKVAARLALVLIGWVVRHTRPTQFSVLSLYPSRFKASLRALASFDCIHEWSLSKGPHDSPPRSLGFSIAPGSSQRRRTLSSRGSSPAEPRSMMKAFARS